MPKVILLIEDEALILMDVEAALIDEGYEVITANNGKLAIEAFDADPSRIHAVVTDIRLGKGLSGWDIGHHVREAIPAMPMVYNFETESMVLFHATNHPLCNSFLGH